jgi:enoyl-CoA hydratase
MTNPVLYELDGPIALITMNRPDQRNAVNREMAEAMVEVMRRFEADEQVRVGVLTGAGDLAFSAGADLKSVAAGEAEALHVAPGGFAGLVQYPRTKPLIAAVNGYALAGGCEIALACDTAFASNQASFGLPEVTRGIVAAAGGMFRLQRAIPVARAMELMLTGDRIGADEAHRLGLVAGVLPAGDLMAHAVSVASRIAANAPIAIRETLALARAVLGAHDDQWWEMSHRAEARVHATTDALEGARAFAEKRAPVWTGR